MKVFLIIAVLVLVAVVGFFGFSSPDVASSPETTIEDKASTDAPAPVSDETTNTESKTTDSMVEPDADAPKATETETNPETETKDAVTE